MKSGFFIQTIFIIKLLFKEQLGTEENYYDDSYFYHLHCSSPALHHEI